MNQWTAATRALVICWAAALPLVTPAARATAAASVAAGHEIRITTANGATVCTLGYTYTTGRSTYGITAGHCAHSVGDLVTDRDSGATGRVAVTTTDPDPLADDFALLDFGTSPSVSAINSHAGLGHGSRGPPDDSVPQRNPHPRRGRPARQPTHRLPIHSPRNGREHPR